MPIAVVRVGVVTFQPIHGSLRPSSPPEHARMGGKQQVASSKQARQGSKRELRQGRAHNLVRRVLLPPPPVSNPPVSLLPGLRASPPARSPATASHAQLQLTSSCGPRGLLRHAVRDHRRRDPPASAATPLAAGYRRTRDGCHAVQLHQGLPLSSTSGMKDAVFARIHGPARGINAALHGEASGRPVSWGPPST